MVDALALCKIETVEVRVGTEKHNRLTKVTAHRFLDFACHRSLGAHDLFSERWTISHLPSGRCAAHDFTSIEPACAAMIEIARLRNDWSCIEENDAAGENAKRVAEIVKRHDGRARLAGKRRGAELHNDLNGYAENTSA